MNNKKKSPNLLFNKSKAPQLALRTKEFDDRIEYYSPYTGKLHRTDGPAIEYKDGNISYYKQGQLHREDGPALIKEDSQEWWFEDKLHREDGPAILYKNGSFAYYQHGELHREDGPARHYINEAKEWFLKGKRHRQKGPAIEYTDGNVSYYENGLLHRENGPAQIEHVRNPSFSVIITEPSNNPFSYGPSIYDEDCNKEIEKERQRRKKNPPYDLFSYYEKGKLLKRQRMYWWPDHPQEELFVSDNLTTLKQYNPTTF